MSNGIGAIREHYFIKIDTKTLALFEDSQNGQNGPKGLMFSFQFLWFLNIQSFLGLGDDVCNAKSLEKNIEVIQKLL